MSDLPFVSVIIPARDAEGRIENLLISLAGQDYPKDRFEIIVADGRSEDATAEIARRLGAKVLDNEKIRQGAGRNIAVTAARGDIVAFSEDDCVLPANWLRAGVGALMGNPGAAGVGGPTPPPMDAGDFARAAGTVFSLAGRAGYSVQSGEGKSPVEAADLPGGNSMYRKEALEKFLPIREGLAEDVDLNHRMRKAGIKLLFVPDFFAWHRKRESPAAFYRQIRRYGIGRRRLGRVHPEVVRPLHWVAALAAPAGALLITALALAGQPAMIAAVFAALLIAMAAVAIKAGEAPRAALCIPLAMVIFAIAWSAGFLAETIFPGRVRP